jgi:hypothetical protein
LESISLQAARAKIGFPDSNAQIQLHLVQNATWLDSSNAVQQKDVSSVDYITSVPLGNEIDFNPPMAIRTIVAIPAIQPPQSTDSKVSPPLLPPDVTGSLTKLTMTVTDSDRNGAQQIVETVSQLVRETHNDVQSGVTALTATAQPSSSASEEARSNS